MEEYIKLALIGAIIVIIVAIIGFFYAISLLQDLGVLSKANEIPISENSSMWQSGIFGVNDIYNTCLYVSQEQGVVFDGYCYKELPSEDRALESCITGCKLGVTFKEDENVCFDRCQRYLIELK